MSITLSTTLGAICTWAGKCRSSTALVENKQALLAARLTVLNDATANSLFADLQAAQDHHHTDHLGGMWADFTTWTTVSDDYLDTVTYTPPDGTGPQPPSGPIKKPKSV